MPPRRRDGTPATIELTASSYALDHDAAIEEAEALGVMGATRMTIPAALFTSDPDDALWRYGEGAIARAG